MTNETRDHDLRASFQRMLNKKESVAADLRNKSRRAATPEERSALTQQADQLDEEIRVGRDTLAKTGTEAAA